MLPTSRKPSLLEAGGSASKLLNEGRPLPAGSAGLAALLGLWLVVAPFLFAFGGQGLRWSTLVSGALVLLLAGYNVYRSRTMEADVAAGTRA